ncbi:hypothetical protein I316_04592 [Kwoniella heveanensis BCC8398]|uniref:Uncharacterized protein n=1 Tax=Kwoniella heveanensis BCC8398 TaxID=1296120 RepID=A0A1B9GS32_9TREE|nr:hypothetical protein I316_04592 [Kwoniella heveanensis BCC8398]
MFEYLAFARHHAVGAKFVSIILECSTETNLERLVGQDRPEQGKTKLVDVEVLREMRGRAVIHRYGLVSGSGHENGNGEQGACTAEGVSYEWEIDSTGRTALEIADYIAQKIATLRHRASASLTT